MPKSLRPGGKYPFVLSDDRDMDPAPTFYLKYLSYDEQMTLGETYDRAIDLQSKDDTRRELLAVITASLVGWENMGDRPFDPSVIASFMDFREICELANAALLNGRVSSNEKKS